MRKLAASLVVMALALAGFAIFQGITPDHRDIQKTLYVGVLPDEGEAAMRDRFIPLLTLLSEATGMEAKLILPNSYEDLLHRFGKEELDLAYFGGLTFVRANDQYQAEPLVMRNIDTLFTSVFFVGGNATLNSIDDAKSRRLSFGSRLSTSGHLMPRKFLGSEHQINPENFFSEIHYSGSHENTAYHVRDGLSDIGVANSEIIRKMLTDGRLNKDSIKIIWETPPYADYVWGVQHKLDERAKRKIRETFLNLDKRESAAHAILSDLGADYFLPAGLHEFRALESIARQFGMAGAGQHGKQP